MAAQTDVARIIQIVERQLKDAEKRGVHLGVRNGETKLEDDWLYVCVTPQSQGDRASDHAELMSEIEKNLRDEGYENVLLVPAVGD